MGILYLHQVQADGRTEEASKDGGSEGGRERGSEAEWTKDEDKENGSEAGRRKEERVSIGTAVLDEAGVK